MYTVLKNIQIVIALLKEYDIKHIIISPGTRNGSFSHSVEDDPFFKCYSVVDERSAAFFALGIAKQLLKPVVVTCTSSTAACNYFSAVTEAFYSHIPLIALTFDRSPYLRNQLEKQQIEQVAMYGKMCRKAVDLPMNINNTEDFWYCERLVNEALLELDHHKGGPVQINVPAHYNLDMFSDRELPKVKRIYKNELCSPYTEHELKLVEQLHNSKKIMLQCGSEAPWSDKRRKKAQEFAEKYNCTFVVQHMSNTGLTEALHITAGTDICNCFQKDEPEIFISMGGPTQMMYFDKLRKSNTKHWLINLDGEIQDPTHHITDIFETSFDKFLDFFNEQANEDWKNSREYENQLQASLNAYIQSRPQLTKLTNIYVIREFCKQVPKNSMVSMSILNAIRIVETFPLAENVDVYANVGAYGIDGCMSTFIGQATVIDRPAFLVIGDLSFIYDMNSIWIRHVSDNVHILLINNHEGIEMRRSFRHHGDLRRHITAGHHSSPRGWIEENGFNYYTASTIKELNNVFSTFMTDTKKCVLEVFTNEPDDTSEAFRYFSYEMDSIKFVKSTVKSVLGAEGTQKLKKLLGRDSY